MITAEAFSRKNQELQQIIAEEIRKAENGRTERNIHQLKTIGKELVLMQRKPGAALCYPRIIVDSWGHGDPLGNQLLELASLYEKMTDRK